MGLRNEQTDQNLIPVGPIAVYILLGSAMILFSTPLLAEGESTPLKSHPSVDGKIVANTPNDQIAQQEKPPLRQAWRSLSLNARNPSISRQERLAEIEWFLATYTPSKKIERRVHRWKRALETGHEPESYTDPVYMRTRPDWVAVRLMGSNYGLGLSLEPPIKRWRWFYLGGRITGGGGARGSDYDTYDDHRGWVALGAAAGVPFHLGGTGHHALHIGGSVMFGFMKDYITYQIPSLGFSYGHEDDDEPEPEPKEEPDAFTVGAIAAPEISYVVRISKRLALQIGAEVFFPLNRGDFKPDSDDSRPPVMYVGFIGIRI